MGISSLRLAGLVIGTGASRLTLNAPIS